LEYKTPIMISSGYVAAIDPTACRACGKCAAACPFAAVAECAADGGTEGRACYQVNQELCMGCEVCAGACRHEAITFRRDLNKPEPLDVRLLS
jgi:MinD superfamily P-loop ATPase